MCFTNISCFIFAFPWFLRRQKSFRFILLCTSFETCIVFWVRSGDMNSSLQHLCMLYYSDSCHRMKLLGDWIVAKWNNDTICYSVFFHWPFRKLKGEIYALWDWVPLNTGMFLTCLFEVGTVVLEKNRKKWKAYRRQTDKQLLLKPKWAISTGSISFFLLWNWFRALR